MCNKRFKNRKKGFTLMELLVSLGIVAALSMMVTPMIMGNVQKSKLKADISNANAIAVAVKSELVEGAKLKSPLVDTELTKFVEKYFDGQLPKSQSIPSEEFTITIEGNIVKVTAGTTQFYPVDESTFPED